LTVASTDGGRFRRRLARRSIDARRADELLERTLEVPASADTVSRPFVRALP
jgi:hypothetical protein